MTGSLAHWPAPVSSVGTPRLCSRSGHAARSPLSGLARSLPEQASAKVLSAPLPNSARGTDPLSLLSSGTRASHSLARKPPEADGAPCECPCLPVRVCRPQPLGFLRFLCARGRGESSTLDDGSFNSCRFFSPQPETLIQNAGGLEDGQTWVPRGVLHRVLIQSKGTVQVDPVRQGPLWAGTTHSLLAQNMSLRSQSDP